MLILSLDFASINTIEDVAVLISSLTKHKCFLTELYDCGHYIISISGELDNLKNWILKEYIGKYDDIDNFFHHWGSVDDFINESLVSPE